METSLTNKSFKPRTYIPNLIRPRNKLTDHQFQALESLYLIDNNPLLSIRRDLAHRLGLTQRCIQIWFQNRRAKSIKMGELVDCGSSGKRVKEVRDESSEKSNSVRSSSSVISDEDAETLKKKPRVSEYWMTTMSCSKIVNY